MEQWTGNFVAGFTLLMCKWYVVNVDKATPRRGWDTVTPSGILVQPSTDSASLSARKRKSVVFVDPTEESSPDQTSRPVCYTCIFLLLS